MQTSIHLSSWLFIQGRTIALRILLPNKDQFQPKNNVMTSQIHLSWPYQFTLRGVKASFEIVFLIPKWIQRIHTTEVLFNFFLFLPQKWVYQIEPVNQWKVFNLLWIYFIYNFFINERFGFQYCLYKRMSSDFIDKGVIKFVNLGEVEEIRKLS